MATVETVLGPIDVSELGVTLSHEHVMVSEGLEYRYYPWLFDIEQTKRVAIRRWTEAKAAGVDAVVDLTTPDLGRDLAFVREVSLASGVHVVAATGVWRDIPRSFWHRDPDEIAAIFVREIEVGIDDTGVKAAVIKVANDREGVTPEGERVLRGAARALKRTGRPISTHSYAPGRVGARQVEIFAAEGAPMDRIAIGHSDDTIDLDYLESLLKAGVYLSMDRFEEGEWPGSPTWTERVATVKALVARGWAHRIMLGHDYPPPFVPAGQEADRDAPNPYVFLQTVAIPALRSMGVGDDAIELMTRRAPAQFLAGAG